MSFILDALKKSETERQRGDGPALHEMKMAPPRQRVATWLIVLAALLLINIAVLCVVLLRGTHGPTAANDTGSAPEPVAEAAPATVAAPTPTPAPVVNSPLPTVSPPPTAPAPSDAQAPATAAAVAPDDVPAVEPSRAAAAGDATGGNGGPLPTYRQAAAAPGSNLPDLTLNLHSYSPNAADRFVFLNMTKLREGQTSPQGIRVESITPDGAILSWQGSRFLMPRQ